MRETFRSWLRPTDSEFDELWGTCVFTFDTNVLLNLYRYTEQASSDLLSAMDKVSHRAWLPHQVGLEFYRHRLATVSDVKASYTDFLKQLMKRKNDLLGEVSHIRRHSRIDKEKLAGMAARLFDEMESNVKAHLAEHEQIWKIEDVASGDPIEQQVSAIFKGRLGEPYGRFGCERGVGG